MFVENSPVVEKISQCIITYAKTLCPDVDVIGEKQKQEYFKTDAEKTVGILLYEFATGTGLSERTFSNIDQHCPFVDMYASGRIIEEIKEDLKIMAQKEALTYNDFKNKGKLQIALELTPGLVVQQLPCFPLCRPIL